MDTIDTLKTKAIQDLKTGKISLNNFFLNYGREWKKDREAVLSVLQTDALHKKFFPFLFNDDEEIMEYSIKRNTLNARFLSERLKNNVQFLLNIIQDKKCIGISNVIKYLPYYFLDDEIFVFPLIEREACCFSYISERLKNKKDFLMKIVEINPRVVMLDSPILKDDEELFSHVIERDSDGWFFGSEQMKNKKVFLVKCLRNNPNVFLYASDYNRNNKRIIRIFMKHGIKRIVMANENDQKLYLYSLKTTSMIYCYASILFKRDRKMGLMAKMKEYEGFFIF